MKNVYSYWHHSELAGENSARIFRGGIRPGKRPAVLSHATEPAMSDARDGKIYMLKI